MSFSIRLATPTDAPLLPAIERSAAQAFVQVPALAWIAEHTVLSSVEHLEFVAAGLEWVVVDGRDRPIGFVCASAFDESLHIEELAVDHAQQGQGLGRRLIAAVRAHAEAQGFAALTLTTFVAVPWNAPFYARLGFERLEEASLSGMLRRQMAYEASRGLQGRCAMRLSLRD
ncbi:MULTISPECIES: GNAT family N-acetyltransferase [Pseudomonas]|jgi:predicted N-acetyltransferase YhbS|uniref:GNAT family N-acetyltransferase n=1 Tax=Pseudomonas TaxID=286 RepID=UPI000B4EC157|nr:MULTISPECIES: GNAT family N-acetyltransferase [Pseudomonas]MCO7504423.1 GNAT family N-acetyltransferase [Pseudomonas sp. VE 267-6A]MCO7529633.1 GNAT family N-acetyltransferase [Pseudomonas sp. 2]OUM27345.1 GNAT family N-acetyltransferase [Pseudomonas sp. 1239]